MENLNTLTARELAVMELTLKGMTAQQIANEIYVSRRTVEFHLGNLKTKLRVNSKAQLCAMYAKSHAHVL